MKFYHVASALALLSSPCVTNGFAPLLSPFRASTVTTAPFSPQLETIRANVALDGQQKKPKKKKKKKVDAVAADVGGDNTVLATSVGKKASPVATPQKDNELFFRSMLGYRFEIEAKERVSGAAIQKEQEAAEKAAVAAKLEQEAAEKAALALKQEQEAKAKAEQEAKEEAARLKAIEDARLAEEARIKAEEEAARKAKEEAERIKAAEEAARLKAIEDARLAEEARIKAEAEAARKAKEEAERLEQERLQKEEEERQREMASLNQPKSPEVEKRLKEMYGSIPDTGERAFAILTNLGLVQVSPDPNDPDYDSSRDNELVQDLVHS